MQYTLSKSSHTKIVERPALEIDSFESFYKFRLYLPTLLKCDYFHSITYVYMPFYNCLDLNCWLIVWADSVGNSPNVNYDKRADNVIVSL